MVNTATEIIKELNSQKKTGVLTFKLENIEHLLSFYFKNGEVYHISFGERKNNDCLHLPAKFEKYFFVSNVRLNVERKCPALEKIIESLERYDCAVTPIDRKYFSEVDVTEDMSRAHPGAVVSEGEEGGARTSPGELLSPDVIRGLENALFDIVGPAAALLLDEQLQKSGCRRGSQISRSAFREIVDKVCEYIPDEEKAVFKRKFIP